MSETLKIIAVSLAAFAVYLPAAYLVGRDFVPAPRPDGSVVETATRIHFDHPDHYLARLSVFTPARFPDVSKITVYEGLTPLSDTNFTPDAGAYVVRFKATDGSDPRTNGRNYWVVSK